MKKVGKIILKSCKWIGISLLCIIASILVVRFVGKTINGRTPNGGINESMYVEINGTKQWINIYGEDTENPVLLYLHGGPGSSTSDIDYAFTRKWAEGDDEAMKLVEQLTPEDNTIEHIKAKNTLMERYGYDLMVDGSDYNLVTTILFNPNYSIIDWVKYFQRDMSAFLDFYNSDEMKAFSLKDRCNYEVPYFNINGDKDYQTNFNLAQEYFDRVNAPYKQMFIMKKTTHGLLESKSDEFSEILHEIATINND